MICHPCKYQLEKSYQFKKKCETADIKLRKHVKLIHQLTGPEDDDSRSQDSRSENEQQSNSGKSKRVKQLLADLVSTKTNIADSQTEGDPIEVTEEELVGGYILGVGAENADMEDNFSEDPENITLVPTEERSAKARCTIRGSRIKQEQESDEEAEEIPRGIISTDNQKVYRIDVSNQSPSQLQQHAAIGNIIILVKILLHLDYQLKQRNTFSMI